MLEENDYRKLNKHVHLELQASLFYKYCSGIFRSQYLPLTNLSEKFSLQSLEEYQHADQIIDYLISRGSTFQPTEDLSIPSVNIEDNIEKVVKDILNISLEIENKVRDSFTELCNTSDLSLYDFCIGWIRKQDEEITEFEKLISLLDISDLLTFDGYLKQSD